MPRVNFNANINSGGGHFLDVVSAAVKYACALVLVAGWLCVIPAAAQQARIPDYGTNPEWFPRVYKPYATTKVPEVQLTNSSTVSALILSGKISISLSQLMTAARENNLDILAAGINLHYAETDMLRARGGGAPRGGAGVQIPSSLFAGAIGTGVGGISGLGGFGSVGGISGGARQVFAFPRGSYDPSLAVGFSVDQTTSPLNTTRVAGLNEVVTKSTALQTRYSQAFVTGTSVSVSFNNMRQSSTQRFLLYNPDFISTFSITVTQQLLSGFGYDVGRRFLEVAKNETKIMKESERLQLNTTLAQAENVYWDVVAARENVRVAEQSLEVARRLRNDNKTREELGYASGLDVTTAESEIAARQRDFVSAQTVLQTKEVDLKNIISKEFDLALGEAKIEPTDVLPDPKPDDIPKLSDALASAMKNRPEIRQAETNILTQEIAVRYGRDALKPSLIVFGVFNSSGLYGNRLNQNAGGSVPVIIPGGMRQAMNQVLRWSYPEYAVGFSFSISLRNRAAQADSYRAKFEKQQSEIILERTRNSVALEVRKAIIGLVQAKAQVEAAHKAADLSGQALAAEEVRLSEGLSIPYEVIRRQRDFRSAQFAEVQARTGYAKALVELNRSIGALD
jgi:outer membrane protein TolC